MTTQNEPTFLNPDEAFKFALMTGRLSNHPDAPNYAGNYMYMGSRPTDDGGLDDMFKNTKTRMYDV